MKTRQLSLILLAAAAFLTACSHSAPQAPKGHLVIIGGGARPDYMMDRFFDYGGGKDKPFVVITTASDNPGKTMVQMTEEFKRRGVENVRAVAPTRSQAGNEAYVDSLLDGVSGIYFSGGSQNRIADSLRCTLLHERLMKIYTDGGVIGGTSAGAGMMSDPMIVRNHKDGADVPVNYIQENFVYMLPGMGFLEGVLIDQHFIKRARENRSFSAVLEHPDMVLMGIDESTALIVSSGTEFEVCGESCVMVMEVDPKNVTRSEKGLLGTSGMTVRILLPGDTYSLRAL